MRLPKVHFRLKLFLSLFLIATLPLLAVNLVVYNLAIKIGGTNELLSVSWLISGGLVFLAFVISFILSTRMSRPVRLLQEFSKALNEKNLDFRVNIKSGDELEDLGNSLNIVATYLKEVFTQVGSNQSILAAERNKLAVALANIGDGVIAVDQSKKIAIFNKAASELLGLSVTDVLNKPMATVMTLYEDDKPLAESVYCPMNLSDDHIVNKVNLKLLSSSGKEVQVNIVASPIQNSDLGCILTLHDVSKEKELEKMQLDFVSMAAHELKTPLTSIKGYLSVFMDENKAKFNDDQNMFLNRINNSTQQLMALIENLLNVSRIERNAFTVARQSADWAALVRQSVEDFKVRAHEKQIILQFIEPKEKLPEAEVDRLRIVEVVSNLVANAINYTQAGGKINVWIEKKEGFLITHIADNGPGIPKEAQAHLFNKFYRVKGKLEQKTNGTGLGLYISKAIVDMHHGQIWLNSDVGMGSVFSFSVPIAQQISLNV